MLKSMPRGCATTGKQTEGRLNRTAPRGEANGEKRERKRQEKIGKKGEEKG
jgi:hypothetical protein